MPLPSFVFSEMTAGHQTLLTSMCTHARKMFQESQECIFSFIVVRGRFKYPQNCYCVTYKISQSIKFK